MYRYRPIICLFLKHFFIFIFIFSLCLTAYFYVFFLFISLFVLFVCFFLCFFLSFLFLDYGIDIKQHVRDFGQRFKLSFHLFVGCPDGKTMHKTIEF